jgi:hypothetical protein
MVSVVRMRMILLLSEACRGFMFCRIEAKVKDGTPPLCQTGLPIVPPAKAGSRLLRLNNPAPAKIDTISGINCNVSPTSSTSMPWSHPNEPRVPILQRLLPAQRLTASDFSQSEMILRGDTVQRPSLSSETIKALNVYMSQSRRKKRQKGIRITNELQLQQMFETISGKELTEYYVFCCGRCPILGIKIPCQRWLVLDRYAIEF